MSEDWRERLAVYPRIFVLLYVFIGGWWVLTGPGLHDRGGNPVGGDFVTFYAAGQLVAEGRPEAAYDLEAIHATEQAALQAEMNVYAWHYPPAALLGVRPLALFPFGVALGGWLLISLGLFIGAVRLLEPRALWLGLAFPGLFQNLIHGQNGCLTLALVGGGLLLLEKRPWLAGLVLGLLSYKPHLLPVMGVALLAGRQWRPLVTMAISAALPAGLSWLLLGPETWTAFVHNIPFALSVVDHAGPQWWTKMPSTAATLRLLGVPPSGASLGQGAVTLATLAGVAWMWWTDAPRPLRYATAALGALLATPYVFHYDLVLLALPTLWYAQWRPPEDWGRGEIAVMALAWAAPVGTLIVARLTGVQLGPVLFLGMMGMMGMGARAGSKV
ncbi:MAG: DUF2029 domain-containing protein [Alphaproteobacteria bacterium]|nr:DUF2029 domain-containing protein [Alphaproteobacteria bacterium]MCB9793430.1 DUF2029 domain-containing protein [Alphaproteobacteria bacterium]